MWVKYAGKLGSTEGGRYLWGSVDHYVKFPKREEQAYTEVSADNIYKLFGANTLDHQACVIYGQTASVSVWRDDLTPLGKEGWLSLDRRQKEQAVLLLMISILVNNWDLVGLAYDNVVQDRKGNLFIVDTGGSFKFRAMGEFKFFYGDPSIELAAFLNPEKLSGSIFSPMCKQDPELFRVSAMKLLAVPDDALSYTIVGLDADEITKLLIKRRTGILKRFAP